MTGAFHIEILPKHFRICAAEVELRAKLIFDQFVQRTAIEPEQPERKIGIDFADVHFGAAARLFRVVSGPRLGLDAMLNEVFRHIRT